MGGLSHIFIVDPFLIILSRPKIRHPVMSLLNSRLGNAHSFTNSRGKYHFSVNLLKTGLDLSVVEFNKIFFIIRLAQLFGRLTEPPLTFTVSVSWRQSYKMNLVLNCLTVHYLNFKSLQYSSLL